MKYLLLLLSCAASAQVQHGTVVVWNVADDRLIVAADSRVTYNKAFTPFQQTPDTYCKLAVLVNNLVFTSVNTASYTRDSIHDMVDSWNNTEVARAAIAAHPRGRGEPAEFWLKSIAFAWGLTIAEKWQWLYKWHPQVVIQSAQSGDGAVTGAMFAVAEEGKLYQKFIGVRFDATTHQITTVDGPNVLCWPCGQDSPKVCAAGQVSIVEEFCTAHTERAKAETWVTDTVLPAGSSKQAAKTVRLAELTAKYDPALVGGPIDALELSYDGHVRWLARKPNCTDPR